MGKEIEEIDYVKKPIFKHPVGPSDCGSSRYRWNNLSMGTTRSVICELCGTTHPELPENSDGYILGSFLGMQVVEECCGKVLDIVYKESGEEFTREFLYEFARNPLDPYFGVFLLELESVLKEAGKKVKGLDAKLTTNQNILKTIQENQK